MRGGRSGNFDFCENIEDEDDGIANCFNDLEMTQKKQLGSIPRFADTATLSSVDGDANVLSTVRSFDENTPKNETNRMGEP